MIEGLRIGMDGKRAVNNNTGLGNYSRLVVDVLSEKYPANEYRLYVPQMRHNPRLAPLLERDNVKVVTPVSRWGRIAPSIWRVSGVTDQIKADKVDLFHGLSNELPLNIYDCGIPSVVTIHDLIFRRFPEYYKAADRRIYDYKFERAAVNATRVIAITECTKRDIVDMYHIPEDKIDVVYQGCHEAFGHDISPVLMDEVAALYSLPERYIIAVGTVESRKNQLLAVKALERLDDDVQLLIVGRRTGYADEIDRYVADHGLTARVRFLEGVPFDHLPALYAMARLSSYTSRFEGFGIPVIESISTGTPVIAATGSSLEEAGGPGAVYVDPDDVEAYVTAARMLIDNDARRRDMVIHGQSYITRFSPENFAAGLMDSYSKALNNA